MTREQMIDQAVRAVGEIRPWPCLMHMWVIVNANEIRENFRRLAAEQGRIHISVDIDQLPVTIHSVTKGVMRKKFTRVSIPIESGANWIDWEPLSRKH